MEKEQAYDLALRYLTEKEWHLRNDATNLEIREKTTELQNALAMFHVDTLNNNEEPDPESEFARSINDMLSDLLEQSETCPYSYEGAVKICVAILERKQPFPAVLSDWLVLHLKKETRPPRKPGKSKYKNMGRDLHIAWAVHTLEQRGVTATRSDASSTTSACDIVSDVLIKHLKMPISYPAVKKIWSNHNGYD
jgi:hypothetical protein